MFLNYHLWSRNCSRVTATPSQLVSDLPTCQPPLFPLERLLDEVIDLFHALLAYPDDAHDLIHGEGFSSCFCQDADFVLGVERESERAGAELGLEVGRLSVGSEDMYI